MRAGVTHHSKFILLAVALAAAAHGSGLDEIRATQRKLIAARDSGKSLGDEVPLEAVALAKRQLLSWLESRLPAFWALQRDRESHFGS